MNTLYPASDLVLNHTKNGSFNKPVLPVLNRAHKDTYIHYEAMAQGIDLPGFKEPVYQWESGDTKSLLVRRCAMNDIQTATNYIPHKIYGDGSIVEESKRLCMKYLDIFHTCLKPEPAKLPPMVIDVDLQAWRVNSNKGPARQQTGTKQHEIEKQVSGML